MAEVWREIQQGRQIEAIKRLRQAFPQLGLKEARDAVAAMARHEPAVLSQTTMVEAATAGATVQDADGGSIRRTNRAVGCLLLIVLLTVGIGVVATLAATGVGIFGAARVQEAVVSELTAVAATVAIAIPEAPVGTALPQATALPELATEQLQFGGQEGVGPGFFNDTRRLGVDGQGRIYTGDYTGGRVQVFNEGGRFLGQWMVSGDRPMIAMAVDRQGVVYLVEGRRILRFDGISGASLGPLPYPEETDFRALATGSDGSLVALARDRLVRFAPDGTVSLDRRDPFAAIAGFRTTHEDLAVDGAGHIYVLGADAIFHLDAEGNLVDRIGGKGDAPGQFSTSPTALAVDGRGRIYANDFDGIQVFDAQGLYLGEIPFSGVAFDMVVTDDDRLVIMDRNGNRVLVLQPQP